MGELLKYGAIGLGLALATLAFLLLQREQKVARPRREIIRTIYVFLGFALVLSAFGFGLEYMKLSQDSQQLLSSTSSTNSLERLRAAAHPLLNARTTVIETLPDSQQKTVLLQFQREFKQILKEEDAKTTNASK